MENIDMDNYSNEASEEIGSAIDTILQSDARSVLEETPNNIIQNYLQQHH